MQVVEEFFEAFKDARRWAARATEVAMKYDHVPDLTQMRAGLLNLLGGECFVDCDVPIAQRVVVHRLRPNA